MSSSAPTTMKLALCQLSVTADKEKNIQNCLENISKCEEADMIVLPECWNSPYAVTSFPVYAEKVPAVGEPIDPSTSPSVAAVSNAAKSMKKWIIGGSVPERDGDKLYNTCTAFDPEGNLIGKHRKVHLFDIDVPGRITFKESDSLTAGETPTLINTPWGKIGVGICYDIRFPEYAILLRRLGARMILYPGAFNMVTGPAHWELLQRARAVDNQLYVAACSPARDTTPGGYVAWGHSTIVSPWGEIVATTDETQSIVIAELDLSKIDEMRTNIPCWKQKRADMYEVSSSFL
jgi:omega-amidase